ncbi:MAG: AMP-binding protein [Methylocystaceae bacterium]|nr:AMP-binding protein [Methylocystaceae bacterium]
MLKKNNNYEDIYESFQWDVPKYFNMGVSVCDHHADLTPDKVALIVEQADGFIERYSFEELRRFTNKLANLLVSKGVKRENRVSVLLTQSMETAASHVASWKAGFITIPLFTLFQQDALEFRLNNSTARVLVTDKENYQKIKPLRAHLPALEFVFLIDGEDEGALDLYKELEGVSEEFTPITTKPDDPALIIYTSGTTGNPKGALHGHRVLLGHIPCVQMCHEFAPVENDLFWTPAEWAWIGGLMNILMAALYLGIPVLAYRARKFDPEAALSLMERHGVRNIFMPPTALKIMRQLDDIAERYDLKLRTVTVGGEPMGEELLQWGRKAFGVTINEFFGQTECNLVASNCAKIMPVKPGSMGRPVPGHHVAIVNQEGKEVPRGEVGDIAVHKDDPVQLLHYWDNPQATEKKYRNDWLIMGDQGYMDEDGYIFFVGRDDDLITSAGYRIGPSEIEDCLTKHEAVAMAAVIGVPDPIRTESVKAFIILRDGFSPSTQLETTLRNFVKDKLSPHEYPRAIEFVEKLPLTETGKIRRKDLRAQEIEKQKTT